MSEEKQNQIAKPIIFVNNPITSIEKDVIGFASQIQIICNAVENGATMIGIIADYGTGKSSMTEMLKNRFVEDKNPIPLKVNMWDSLSGDFDAGSDETVSTLTKSFLFQMANGHSHRFGSYVNRLLSKNYGNISFSTNHFVKLSICMFLSACLYVLYKIAGASGTGIMQFLPPKFRVLASCFKLFSPLFILGAFVFAIIGIKDICIAFSHWKMPESKKPEISDIFDIYRIIIDEIAPSKRKKQLVLIDDLDRISDKKAVITFLKELYRFQDSIAEDKHQFVFVISIKPESNLTDSSDSDEGIFSKIFDTTVYLKPIHFDDYDSILLEMIKADSNKHKALEELSGEEIDGVLPESFKWIKRGSNLTIRDLKERLNQAVSIMVSLVNKSYEGNSAASFQACAAVSYLENHFPKDYYRLIRKEVEFADFMKKSLPIIDRQSGHGIDELRTVFKESFQNESFSTEFIAELCSMIIGEIFNDDFRMYFYTYPKGSHIKTTYEKEICDYLLFPNLNNNYELLAEAVSHSYKNSTNDSVEATIRALSNYPMALLKNDILYYSGRGLYSGLS